MVSAPNDFLAACNLHLPSLPSAGWRKTTAASRTNANGAGTANAEKSAPTPGCKTEEQRSCSSGCMHKSKRQIRDLPHLLLWLTVMSAQTFGQDVNLPGPSTGFAKPNASHARTEKSILSDVYLSLYDFGAVCDDATDDNKAINAAFAQIATTGGTLLWPGKCKTNETVILPFIPAGYPAGIVIKGSGSFAYQGNQYASPSLLDCSAVSRGDCLDIAAAGVVIENMDILYNGKIGAPIQPPAAPSLSYVKGPCVTGSEAFYWVKTTYTTASKIRYAGETALSAETPNFTVPIGNCLQVASPAANTDVIGYRLYIGSASNREQLQSRTPTSIGSSYTMTTRNPKNEGLPPLVDTTAGAAVYANNVPSIRDSRIRSTVGGWGSKKTTYAPSDGLKLATSLSRIGPNTMVLGFNRGVVMYAFGPSNNASNSKPFLYNSYIRDNNYGVVLAGATNVEVVGNEFMEDAKADLLDLWSNDLYWGHNYQEQNDDSEKASFILGSSGMPNPTAFSLQPNGSTFEQNNITCSAASGIPLFEIVTGESTRIMANLITGCSGSTTFVRNGGSATNTVLRNNLSPDIPRNSSTWLSGRTGVQEYDVTCEGPSIAPCSPTFAGTDTRQKVVLTGWCTGNVGTRNNGNYALVPFGAGTTCADAPLEGTPSPFACTVLNLYATALHGGGQLTSGKVTFYQNGSPTLLSCSMGKSLACNDTAHRVSLAAGDTWGFAVTTGQISDTTSNIHASIECQ